MGSSAHVKYALTEFHKTRGRVVNDQRYVDSERDTWGC